MGPMHMKGCWIMPLVLLLLCVWTLTGTAASAASGKPIEHTALYANSGNGAHFPMCPSGPICSRAHTPFARKFKYCNKVTSFFSSLFTSSSTKIDFRHFPLELPFATDTAMRLLAKADLENLLLMRLIGQDHLQEELLDVLFKKLYFPSTPLVLHLAGDNGVGKSYTAKLISLALSLRCAGDSADGRSGDSGCESGDALLTISGTAYDGEPVVRARARIVEQVTAFSARHPHGIVLLDDVTAMDPDLVRSLAPLLGRAAYFPDQLFENTTATATASASGSDTEEGALKATLLKQVGPSLYNLLVVVTTDFGKQGRTVGLTTSQIRAMVLEEFSSLYGSLLPAYTRTFVYVPFSEQTAVQVVLATVDYLPCQLLFASGGAAAVGASEIEAEAAQFLAKKYKDVWRGKENGHALRRAIEDEVLTPLLLAMEELQQPPDAVAVSSSRQQQKQKGRGRARGSVVVSAASWDAAAPVDVRFFLDKTEWRISFSLSQHGEVVYTTGTDQSGEGRYDGDDEGDL